jgi:hypothetical protein
MKKMSGYEKFLRSQYRGEKYIYFRSFLGGYLYQGLTWAEVPDSIQNMLDLHWTESDEAFLKELIILKKKKDWKFIEEFVYEHSGRGLSEEKLKLLFKRLIDGLIENLAKSKS